MRRRLPLAFALALSLAAAAAARTAAPVTLDRLAGRPAEPAAPEPQKLPAGDDAYLAIRDFCVDDGTRAWFDIAYSKGHALWRVDFARALARYLERDARSGGPAAPSTDLALPPDAFERLLALAAKFDADLAELGVAVAHELEGGRGAVSFRLPGKRLLRYRGATARDISRSPAPPSDGPAPVKATPLREIGSDIFKKSKTTAESVWVYSSAREERAPADPDTERRLREKVTFHVTNRPIWEVLEGFLRSAELNASVSHAVPGQITLYIKDTSVREVLDHICTNHGLSWQARGGFVEIRQTGAERVETMVVKLGSANAQDVSQIASGVKSPAGTILVDKKTNSLIIKDTPEAIAQMKGLIEAVTRMTAADRVVTRLIGLQHSEAEKLKTMLARSLTPEIGAMEVDARTNTLVVTDLESRIAEIESIVRRLDADAKTSKVIPCKYAAAEDLKTTLNASLKAVLGVSSDSFLIESDKTTNSLIVTASPVNLAKIEEFLARLDVRTKQVQIEAKIVQVNLTRDETLGVNWDRLIQTGGAPRAEGIQDGNNFIGFKTFNPVGEEGIGGFTYKMGSLTTDQLRLVMNALKRRDDSKVVSCPTIVTTNRKKAFVNVETSYPVRRETVVATNTGPVTSITYDKQNVSVRLEVTPAINPDGYIAMEVNPKIQSLTGRVDNSQPIVSTKESQTNIVVRNGHTIVIAGLIEEEKTRADTDIPVMARVPLLGRLFQTRADAMRRSETIILITPRIVDGGVPTRGTTVPRFEAAGTPCAPPPASNL